MNVAVKNEMAPPKAMVVAPKGAPVRLKGATLKGKSGVKRPSDKELALAKAVEQSKKFSLALPSILASGQGVAGASSSPEPDVPTSSVPAREDDGRVELIFYAGSGFVRGVFVFIKQLVSFGVCGGSAVKP
jgi:hypothetical protein